VVIWETAIEPTACGKMVTVWQMLYIQIPVFYLMNLNYRKRVVPTKVICFLFCKKLSKVSCLHSLSLGSKPMVSLSLVVLPKPAWFRSQDPYLLFYSSSLLQGIPRTLESGIPTFYIARYALANIIDQ
jgi:hypothetical protein